MTLECSIKGSGIQDKDCNAANFNATKCDYVVLRNKRYACDEVKRNYSSIIANLTERVESCDKQCSTNSAATVGKSRSRA